MAYRVPRRFILPPDDPPPYGFVALSLVGHGMFLLAAMVFSAYIGARIDRSQVYIVNLVPSPPALGTAAAPTPKPTAERPAKPPEPVQKTQKAEVREQAKPMKAETPVKAPPPLKPERVAERAPEPPPPPPPPPPRPSRAPEVARALPPRPDELALPRRAEREAPVLETSAARERLERTPLPPRPPVPSTAPPVAPAPAPPPVARPVEPVPAPRATPPPAPAPSPPAVASRPALEPVRLGRPDAGTAATGSLSLDVSDFPFTYYLRQIQAKISDRWSPPRATAAGGERAVVMFEIGRDGQIKEPRLERESGNALYDQSALRAVVEASPFPPLPAEFKAPSLRVHFGFEYRPDQG
jgi:TonB family protein